MALITDPSLRIYLNGTNITTYDATSTFSLEDKYEVSFDVIGALDGNNDPIPGTDHTIPISTFNNTKLILIHATGNYNIKFTTAVGTFTIASTGTFVLNTSDDFMDTLTAMAINTSVTTAAVNVKVNVYGKVPTA